MKNATTKRRLKTLIKFMRALPPSAAKHFDMKYWFVHEGAHRHKIGEYIGAKTLQHCGTTACALGWAATIPSLRKAGLVVETQAFNERPPKRGRRVLGLTEDQFAALFLLGNFGEGPMGDVKSPKQWARKAEGLMRQWAKE